jgi:hypothetical protein
MALQRALEMLKAGERINDELYRSTVHGLRRTAAAIWVYQPGVAPIIAPITRQNVPGMGIQTRVA